MTRCLTCNNAYDRKDADILTSMWMRRTNYNAELVAKDRRGYADVAIRDKVYVFYWNARTMAGKLGHAEMPRYGNG